MAKAFEVNRSPFAAKKESDNPPAPAASNAVNGWAVQSQSESEPEDAARPPAPPRHTLENAGFITDRETRFRKRNRSWEKSHNNQTHSFRGISPDLRDAVTRTAETLSITASEVARAFMEFSLQSYDHGFLKISPTLNRGKLTIFPKAWGTEQAKWFSNINHNAPIPAIQKKSKAKKQAGVVVAYRGLPQNLIDRLHVLSDENHVPVGEIVSMLLLYALDAYSARQLVLSPVEKNA